MAPSIMSAAALAAAVACALAQQPQLTTSGAGEITAVATDLRLSPTGGGASVSVSGLASSMVIAQGNLTDISTAVTTGQAYIQGRTDSIDAALQINGVSRDALNASIQTLSTQLASLNSMLASANAAIGALAAITDPVGCDLSSLSGWSTNFPGMVATPSATMRGGARVPAGGVVTFVARPGNFISSGSATVTCSANGQTAAGQNGVWSPSSVPSTGSCLNGCVSCADATSCNACNPGLAVTTVPSSPYTRVQLQNPGNQVSLDPIGLSINRRTGAAITSSIAAAGKAWLTDGTPDTISYWLGPNYQPRTCTNPAWIQIDLGANMRVGSVSVWHYWRDQRSYCGQRIAISTTGQFTGEEVELHSSGLYPHIETPQGLTVQANGTIGRYVRHWSAGSERNAYVHFVEFNVAAVPTSTGISVQCQTPSG